MFYPQAVDGARFMPISSYTIRPRVGGELYRGGAAGRRECSSAGTLQLAAISPPAAMRATASDVRNGENSAGPRLIFDLAEWTAFVDATKDGNFDVGVSRYR
jgi:hypothetical protein